MVKYGELSTKKANINLFLNGSKASLTLSNVSGDVNVVINNSTLNNNLSQNKLHHLRHYNLNSYFLMYSNFYNKK